MTDKQYDPAGNNEKAPAKGMASVNTFNEGEDDDVPASGTDNETAKKKEADNVPASDE